MTKRDTLMREHDGTQATILQRPNYYDKEAWKAYWKEQGQSWRTEPEIDIERQKYLAERRSITPDIEQGIYPFKDIDPKLSRADVEWLLATHENGRGPVDWKDESQRNRKGLDLRGADLRRINLYGLLLTSLVGGLFDHLFATDKQREAAAIHFEGTLLSHAHLEGADLSGAHLEAATLFDASLEEANFIGAHLEGADLSGAHLEGAYLSGSHLEEANLSDAFLNSSTLLNHIILFNKELGAAVSLADIHWGDVNVAVVDWSLISVLGDELTAREQLTPYGVKDKQELLENYQTAARAYRQLATLLRNQGLNEEAVRFAYRAQLMQRKVFRYQRKFGQYFFSLFLDLLAGYGYKPWRSFLTYLLVITAFATAYFIVGHTVGPVLSPLGSFVFSMTSFHGRGFFPGGIGLDDPLTVLAALEAFIGLLIEVTFIATLTQRLFGK